MIGPLRPHAKLDLHLHTNRSDGRFGPDEVLRRCVAGGLDVVAITDHDLGTVVAPGLHEVGDGVVQVIAGAEVSGMHQGRELHLLVYFPGEIPEGFRAFCVEQCRQRAARFETAVRNLGLEGVTLDPDARDGRRALTRLHLARALIERGHARDNSEAFGRWLADSHGHVPSLSLQMVDAIAIARGFGGVTSWAHPAIPEVERNLPTFVEAGLQGLEGMRPFTNARDRQFYRKMAHRHGLFLTGGSDWHGWTDPELGLFQLQAREVQSFLDTLVAA